MVEQKKMPEPEIVRTAKKPRKLVPRTASPAGSTGEEVASAPALTGKVPPVRKPRGRAEPVADEAVARHQAVLADALKKAQAIRYDQPIVHKQPEVVKPEKAAKPRKQKLVRDSFAMPESEYGQIAALKKRLLGLGAAAKKSELLRGGIALLAALNDAELKAVMGRVERIRTGRPKK